MRGALLFQEAGGERWQRRWRYTVPQPLWTWARIAFTAVEIKDKLSDAGEGQAMLRGTAMLGVIPRLPDPVCCPHSHATLLYLAAVTMELTWQSNFPLACSYPATRPTSARLGQAVRVRKQVKWCGRRLRTKGNRIWRERKVFWRKLLQAAAWQKWQR